MNRGLFGDLSDEALKNRLGAHLEKGAEAIMAHGLYLICKLHR